MKFFIQDLMEEIKPVVTEKKEFYHRDVSKVISLVGNFGLSGLWCKAQNH